MQTPVTFLSTDIPCDYYFRPDFQKQSSTNPYTAKTADIKLSFKEEQSLRKTLNTLIKDQGKPVSKLSSAACRDILEKLHKDISKSCSIKLEDADFKMVSEWSFYSNEVAKNKLCALIEFLDKVATIKLSQFSPEELNAIFIALNQKKETIQLAAKNAEDITIKVNLGEDSLTLYQTFSEEKSKVTIQHNDDTPYAVANPSLEELRVELNCLVKDNKYKYAANPPIRQLSISEINGALKTFQENMHGWDKVKLPSTQQEITDSIDTKDWHNPKRTQQDRWNIKMTSTNTILRSLEHPESNYTYYSYCVNGATVGLMALNNIIINDSLYIESLVTHPATEGGGGSLIEFAVAQSVKAGYKGRVSLTSLDDDSTQAYLAMGFKIKLGHMMLDPGKDPVNWSKNENEEWKIKKYMDKPYMSIAFFGDHRSLI